MSGKDPNETTVDVLAQAAVDADLDSPFLDLLASGTRAETQKGTGIALATVIGIGRNGNPLVWFPGCVDARGVEARSCVSIGRHNVGSDAVVALQVPGVMKPLILGWLQGELSASRDSGTVTEQRPLVERHVEVDGDRLVITAEQEIVLRCGKSSITLTREGKVVVSGAYISSRSSGVNRVKGASVEIN